MKGLVHKLLDWNREYLICDSNLTIDKISEVFAERFDVFANGRNYLNVDHEIYFDFLCGFKETIAKIDYKVIDTIVDNKSVVLPMIAEVTHLDETIDIFDAMLWLKYDDENKIVLWHEIYTQK
ncbi:hypothetical protein [Francisella marina]|uniref:Nuclear transport factor 2 family protein n=1 Tax=Francisella marina TaxID=2249302 RepID=A0ABX5ZEP7_9GAMM|nr:hypothetical protein [Francisella marina]QEO56642.1 hypothetical protein F0R74_01850 [Francisella marina]QEO59237.1 hypothetical protein F0R75_05375 [Francisella marina]